MGAQFVKHLESANYNRKLFYLDQGAEDLPVITNHKDIMPGSECRSLATGERWILNTHFRWVYIDEQWWCNCGGNTGDGNSDPMTPGEEPVIEGIVISPDNVTVGLGAIIQFVAQIQGDEALSKGITWSIKSQTSKTTKITQDGILTIGNDEASTKIIVRATSQTDPNIYAQAIVNVDKDIETPTDPIVTGIIIVPNEIEGILGQKIIFDTLLSGVNLTDTSVTFSLKGNNSQNTTIDADGILTIDINETSHILIVTATSNLDPSFSVSATVKVVDEQHATKPDNANIIGVTIIPDSASVGKGYNRQFAALVEGIGNPSQEVVWDIEGHTSVNTHITADGVLYVGTDEETNIITIKAYSRYAADKVGQAEVTVLEADEPGVADVTVDDIVIIPDMAEMAQGTWLTFKAVVIGQNNPNQKVKWTLTGANVQTTYVSEQGTLVIGVGETANILTLTATSEQDKNVSTTAYIIVTEPDTVPNNGIEDVPESPLGTKYVRERDEAGRAVWTPVDLGEDGTEGDLDEPIPEITAIKIVPDAVTAAPGADIQFAVVKEGSDELADTVTWSISGQQSENTTISPEGLLKIGEDEISRIIKIKATSTVDTTKSGTATVSVDESASLDEEIFAVYLIPAEGEIIRGHQMMFQTIITGMNLINKDVVYSISSQLHPNTNITRDGLLTVSDKETTSVILVTVTSEADPTKIDTSLVSVIPEELAEEVSDITSIQVLPAYTKVGRGMSAQFAVQIIGVNNPSADVVWQVTGNSSTDTHITKDGILYVGVDEEIHEITVRATAIYQPDKFSEARVDIVSEDTPGIDETTIDAVIITPPSGELETASRLTFKATVIGNNNPSQEVKWTLEGNRSSQTTITQTGVLTVATDETANVLSISATSVVDATKTATAYIKITKRTSLPDTGIEDIPNAPLDQNYVRHMDASGKAIWLKYDEIPHEDFDNIYVRVRDENDNPVWMPIPKCPDDKGEYNLKRNDDGTLEWVIDTGGGGRPDMKMFYGTVADKAELDTFEIPADAIDGDFIFVEADETHDGAPAMYEVFTDTDGTKKFRFVMNFSRMDTFEGKMYLGTFTTKAELDEYEIPTIANPGDFVYVKNDETKNRCPSMYEVYEDGGVKKFRFVLSFGRPPILGDKLDILYVLDNGDHSEYIKDIEILDNFDHTDKRYELYKSTSAWHLVTELHEGFWKTVLAHPDWYKMIVGMKKEDGSTKAYLTCFTDNHEFEHHKDIDIDNPDPIENKLTWTNTVQPGSVFTAADDTRLVQYLFHLDSMTLTVGSQEDIPPDTTPGVTPWATVIGEYSTLANGTTIGPLADVTDPTGYVWVSEHEKFMLGSAGDGSQMFCYNIDTDDYFIFNVPNYSRETISNVEVPFSLATDVNERYFFLYITATIGILGDRVNKTVKQITWNASPYSGLSDPGQYTKPGIDPTGKYYMHTSTNPDTPTFTTFSFETGRLVTEAPIDGTSSSAICLNNNVVFTNTPEGQIITYNFNPTNGSLTVRAHNPNQGQSYTPFACRYVCEATANGNQILCVKVENKSNCPIWFVYDCDSDTIIAQSTNVSDYCEQTNGQAKSCTYSLPIEDSERYLLSMADENGGIVIKYEGSTWTEVEIPFGGLNNTRHEYNQPILMQNGEILITQDSEGQPVGFDLVKMEIIDLESLLNPGGDPHLVQLDDIHFMWCTDEGSQLIHQEQDGTRKVILEIPEQQIIVFGFDR